MGYVKFARKEDVARAMAEMNGLGFDNLIMRIE